MTDHVPFGIPSNPMRGAVNKTSESGMWRYDIQYGPDGEANYAWLYDDTGKMVGTMQTYQAAKIVTAMSASPEPQPEVAAEPVAWRWHDGVAWSLTGVPPNPEGEGCVVEPLYITPPVVEEAVKADAKVRPINVLDGKTLVHIEDDETGEALFSIPLKHRAYADLLWDVTHTARSATP